MGILNAIQALLAKLKALLEALLDKLDPDSVAIVGAAVQNQTLTVDESDVDNDNGQPFKYQWQADGVNIAGATSNTYTLGQNDVGKKIGLALTYTDECGRLVTLHADKTVAVANVNDAVTGAVTLSLPAGEVFAENVLVTANTSALADLDGLGTFHYQWKANGINIDGAINNTYLLTQADVGKNISVTVSYIDGFGTAESVTSAASPPVIDNNNEPTGQVTIDEAFENGNNLLRANTDNLNDADGLGTFSYQWKSYGEILVGETGRELINPQLHEVYTVDVSYIDGGGNSELVTSKAKALPGLNGFGGNDTLFGSNNNEVFDGGTGNDTLTGGGGINTFLYNATSEHDIITDFVASKDQLALEGIQVQSVTITAQGTLVTFDANTSVTLLGVNLGLNDITII